MEISQIVFWENLGFVALASLVLVFARYRTKNTAQFPGPLPPPSLFKVWFAIIWVIGIFLPLTVLIWEGFIQGQTMTLLALGSYLIMMAIQISSEIYCWKKLNSPIWVIVPTLYVSWRIFQVYQGFSYVEASQMPLTNFTLWALLLLWIGNVFVHFSNIPGHMRWKFHNIDATFPALKAPMSIYENQEK